MGTVIVLVYIVNLKIKFMKKIKIIAAVLIASCAFEYAVANTSSGKVISHQNYALRDTVPGSTSGRGTRGTGTTTKPMPTPTQTPTTTPMPNPTQTPTTTPMPSPTQSPSVPPASTPVTPTPTPTSVPTPTAPTAPPAK